MDKTEWRKMIAKHLAVKPINHGQVFTEEIAIPPLQNQAISFERKEDLKRSLTQYKSNLIPLILRRTDKYGEDEEYEVIYGLDWCIVAKELDIEKLWAWVFDLNDDQANAIQIEMEELANISSNYFSDSNNFNTVETELIIDNREINQEIINYKKNEQDNTNFYDNNIEKIVEDKLNKSLLKIQNNIDKIVEDKLNNFLLNIQDNVNEVITDKLNNSLQALTSKLEEIKINNKPSSVNQNFIPSIVNNYSSNKLNLVTASDEEIEEVLENVGAKSNQIKAALIAINNWKSKENLTWNNLKKSTKIREFKVTGFAGATYNKLKDNFDI